MEETDSESRNELFYIREGADERAVTVRELFAELVTGTVSIHTQIRRAAETTAHPLEQDAELSGLLPFYSRKLYARLKGSHADFSNNFFQICRKYFQWRNWRSSRKNLCRQG